MKLDELAFADGKYRSTTLDHPKAITNKEKSLRRFDALFKKANHITLYQGNTTVLFTLNKQHN